MLAVNFRLATEDDLPRLMQMEERCFGAEKFSQETVLAFLVREDTFVVIAEESGELVGTAMCIASDDELEGRIASLAVSEPMRRRGIGSMLLAHCEDVFEELGMTTYSLEVETTNEPAVSMYLSHGYQVASLIQDFYGRGRPAYFMVKKPLKKDRVTVRPS